MGTTHALVGNRNGCLNQALQGAFRSTTSMTSEDGGTPPTNFRNILENEIKHKTAGHQANVYISCSISSADGLNQALMEERPDDPPPHLGDVRLVEVEGKVVADVGRE